MAASAAKAAPGESAAYEHGRPAVRGPLGVSPAGSRRHFGPDVVSTVPIRFDDQPRTAAPEVRQTVAHSESCGWGEERDAQPRQGRQRAGVSVRSCAVSVAPTGATGSEPSIPRLTPWATVFRPSGPLATNQIGKVSTTMKRCAERLELISTHGCEPSARSPAWLAQSAAESTETREARRRQGLPAPQDSDSFTVLMAIAT